MRWLIRPVGAVALVAASPAYADCWIRPRRRLMHLTVVPRDIEDQLIYFTDKVDGKAPAGEVAP